MPKKRSSWKAVQSRKQVARRTKLALIVLIIILGLLVFSKIYQFTQMLSSPWKEANTQKSYSWNGDFNINILIKSKTISLVSYSPKNKQIVTLDIPNQTYLDVPRGFGKWMISSVFDLGGGTLLKETLVNFFALPIDGFLDFTNQEKEDVKLIVSKIREPFSFMSLLPKMKTDLTPLELIKLKMGLSSVRFDKIEQINLLEEDALQKDKLADGTEIFTADPIKLDALLNLASDPIFREEHKTIAVFNSTNYPLLAQKAARLITNLGGDVIITSNSSHQLKNSLAVGEKSKTLERLKQIFNTSDTIPPEDLDSSRAQINIFLGEDYLR